MLLVNMMAYRSYESQRQVAIIRSIHGDHKQALNNLEQLFPIVRVLGKQYPSLYYDFINSLAVEFCELGRIAEAEAACAMTLASPFVTTHLHWKETRDEIAAKRQSATHSVVAVAATPQPERDTRPQHALTLNWLARQKSSLQISVTAIASQPVASFYLIQTILDRQTNYPRTRAPPALF